MLDIVRTVVQIVLAAMFAFMGVLHFVPDVAHGMRRMVPPRLAGSGIRSPAFLVPFTGVCELAGAAGLLAGLALPGMRIAAAIALVVFLVVVFPANAYAAAHPKGFGRAAVPLIPRAIGQLVLMALLVFVAV